MIPGALNSTLPFDDAAPKIRSAALVVAIDPLFIAAVVPTAAPLTSNGATLSIPAYS